jgi:hypothetical protein
LRGADEERWRGDLRGRQSNDVAACEHDGFPPIVVSYETPQE